jgi:hypothetical protein
MSGFFVPDRHGGCVLASMNKRKQERFDLAISAFVKLADEQADEPIEVITRDICSGGALFHTDQPMDVGTEVNV